MCVCVYGGWAGLSWVGWAWLGGAVSEVVSAVFTDADGARDCDFSCIQHFSMPSRTVDGAARCNVSAVLLIFFKTCSCLLGFGRHVGLV